MVVLVVCVCVLAVLFASPKHNTAVQQTKEQFTPTDKATKPASARHATHEANLARTRAEG